MSAIDEIAAERRRQVEVEGWTADHDDEHGNDAMARAAACYAAGEKLFSGRARHGVQIWPWDGRWWKPKDRRRDLIRAAALIVAEIERLDRANKAVRVQGNIREVVRRRLKPTGG